MSEYSSELQGLLQQGIEVPVDTSVQEDKATLEDYIIIDTGQSIVQASMFGDTFLWIVGGVILLFLFKDSG